MGKKPTKKPKKYETIIFRIPDKDGPFKNRLLEINAYPNKSKVYRELLKLGIKITDICTLAGQEPDPKTGVTSLDKVLEWIRLGIMFEEQKKLGYQPIIQQQQTIPNHSTEPTKPKPRKIPKSGDNNNILANLINNFEDDDDWD